MKPAKERIKESYLTLLHQKPYDKINITDIIKLAGINRSTFYRSFADVTDLYLKICEETAAAYISALPPFEREGDAFRFVVMMYERAALPENMELVKLLLGENGSGTFALLGRRMFIDKIAADASDAGIWDERMQHLVTFSADFMVICGYYLLHKEEIDLSPLPRTEFIFDYTADPVESLTQIMRIICGGSSDAQNALFLSTVRMFSEGDARRMPISKLLGYSGFSRTAFYHIYKNKHDYFAKLEDGVNLLLVKAILPIMKQENVSSYKKLLDLWDKYYKSFEQKALCMAFREGYGFRLAANVISKLHGEYVDFLKRETGADIDGEKNCALAFFTCGVVCSLIYYFATMDRDAFFKRMELLYSIRRSLPQ